MRNLLIATLVFGLVHLTPAHAAIDRSAAPGALPDFQDACLQSGGIVGTISFANASSKKLFRLLDSDRPVLFSITFADDTSDIEAVWDSGQGLTRSESLAGWSSLAVTARTFALKPGMSARALWCARTQVLP